MQPRYEGNHNYLYDILKANDKVLLAVEEVRWVFAVWVGVCVSGMGAVHGFGWRLCVVNSLCE